MGGTVAGRVARRLIEAGLNPSTPVAVIENASRRDHRAVSGRLDELGDVVERAGATGPVLIIVGDVVAEGAIAAEPAAANVAAAA